MMPNIQVLQDLVCLLQWTEQLNSHELQDSSLINNEHNLAIYLIDLQVTDLKAEMVATTTSSIADIDRIAFHSSSETTPLKTSPTTTETKS